MIPLGKASTSDLILYSDAGKEITLKINSEGKVIGSEIYFNTPRPLSDFLIESNLVQGLARANNIPTPRVTAQAPPPIDNSYKAAQRSVPFQTYRARPGTIVSKPCCDE